jgi:hypothetical protein
VEGRSGEGKKSTIAILQYNETILRSTSAAQIAERLRPMIAQAIAIESRPPSGAIGYREGWRVDEGNAARDTGRPRKIGAAAAPLPPASLARGPGAGMSSGPLRVLLVSIYSDQRISRPISQSVTVEAVIVGAPIVCPCPRACSFTSRRSSEPGTASGSA